MIAYGRIVYRTAGGLFREEPRRGHIYFVEDYLIRCMQFLSCNMSSSMLVLGVCLIFNNYSAGARWIVGYNHLIFNKREWNNCFIKNTHEISRILPDFLYHLLQQPIFSLFLILSRRVRTVTIFGEHGIINNYSSGPNGL